MIFKALKILIILFFNIIIIYLLNIKINNIPPLGKFLNPFTGYYALSNSDNLPKNNLYFKSLSDTVNVTWDDLRIPHIFAKSKNDLYFAQGYIMAKDRLWQMDFQSLVAEGRLSEIVGEKALEIDKFHRRIGIKYGAINSLETIKKDTVIYNMLLSFSNGINEYIKQINEINKPLEYKILDYMPEKWTPLKTTLILKYMAWTLSGKSTDLAYSKLLYEYDINVINELFPMIPYNVKPIIPENTLFNFQNVNIPNPPDSVYISNPFQTSLLYEPEDGFSNNWVVSSNKSNNNNTMLATDPHLNLSLPSIWYIMHINDTKQNVMGVAIPGAPGIIIGMNDHIAWAETNGYDDVMDWYDIYFKDKSMNEYFYDNAWHQTNKIIEKFMIRGKEAFIDTITYTKHGPVVWNYNYQTAAIGSKTSKGKRTRQIPMGRALRWQAHDGSNEVRTFYELNNAKNYSDFVNALEWFVCPGQNFAYIDKNNIAMWHAGSPPIKWLEQGKFIGDGRDPKYNWGNPIPHNHKPHIKNPEQGFICSANQHPTDNSYPYYLSESFWPSFRALRINEVLQNNNNISIDDMVSLQLDNTNMLAKTILPHMLKQINSEILNPSELLIFNDIKKWDYINNQNSVGASIFDLWYKQIEKNTWLDDLGEKNEYTKWPQVDKLSELIEMSPFSSWFDNKETLHIENFSHIATESFKEISNQIEIQYKKSNYSDLKWGNYQGTNLLHLAKIPGLGNTNLFTSGGLWTVNATTKHFGPSWRSVITMSNPQIIQGIYPGGQSGFPGSKYYDNMINDWIEGSLYDLQFSNNVSNIKGHKIQFIKKSNVH